MKISKLFLVLSIVAIAFAGCGEKNIIKLNLTEGDSMTMKTFIDQDIKQTIMGNEQQVRTNITAIVTYHVNQVTGDTIHMDLQYDRLILDMAMPQMEMSFDSKKKEEGNIMYDVMSQIIGKKINIVLLSNGDIVSISNFEDILNDIIDNMETTGGPGKEQLKKQFNQSFGDQSVVSNFKMMLSYIPKKAVSVGDQWETETETNFMVKGTYDTEWILKEYNSDNALMAGTTLIQSEKSELSMGNPDMPMQIELQGEQKTMVNINPQSGWIKNGASDITMTGTLYLSSAQTGDMEVPMDIQMKINYEVLN